MLRYYCAILSADVVPPNPGVSVRHGLRRPSTLSHVGGPLGPARTDVGQGSLKEGRQQGGTTPRDDRATAVAAAESVKRLDEAMSVCAGPGNELIRFSTLTFSPRLFVLRNLTS